MVHFLDTQKEPVVTDLDTPTFETRPHSDIRKPWHKPLLQRLEISTETKTGGGSTDDGDGLGLVFDTEV